MNKIEYILLQKEHTRWRSFQRLISKGAGKDDLIKAGMSEEEAASVFTYLGMLDPKQSPMSYVTKVVMDLRYRLKWYAKSKGYIELS